MNTDYMVAPVFTDPNSTVDIDLRNGKVHEIVVTVENDFRLTTMKKTYRSTDGIQENINSENALKAYPNPFTDQFIIMDKNLTPEQITIYDENLWNNLG